MNKNKFGDGINWNYHVNEIINEKNIEEIFYKPLNNEKIEKLKKYKQSGKLLDCGCHIGRWIEIFRGNNYDYTGVDQSILALETAKKYKPDGKFIHSLLWNMSFDNEFDIVHTHAVLQHNKLEEQEKILPKMYKALKSNGVLIITESTEPKQTSTQRTYQGWITFIEKHGFKFMESWHKNEFDLEDNYIFIKTDYNKNINNMRMESKTLTKEKLKQWFDKKQPKNILVQQKTNMNTTKFHNNSLSLSNNLYDIIKMDEYWNDKTISLIRAISIWRKLKIGDKYNFKRDVIISKDEEFIKLIFEEAGFKYINTEYNKMYTEILFEKLSIIKIKNWQYLRQIHELMELYL